MMFSSSSIRPKLTLVPAPSRQPIRQLDLHSRQKTLPSSIRFTCYLTKTASYYRLVLDAIWGKGSTTLSLITRACSRPNVPLLVLAPPAQVSVAFQGPNIGCLNCVHHICHICACTANNVRHFRSLGMFCPSSCQTLRLDVQQLIFSR